ncbi:MAG: hypothetical protein AMXMBFR81_30250 [Chthonomonas sp.]
MFGTATRTDTLLAVHLLGETHAAEIARVLGRAPSRIQAAIESLELAGVLAGVTEGKTRRVRLNPRFHAYKELSALLAAMGAADLGLQKRLATERRRPRRTGKPI